MEPLWTDVLLAVSTLALAIATIILFRVVRSQLSQSRSVHRSQYEQAKKTKTWQMVCELADSTADARRLVGKEFRYRRMSDTQLDSIVKPKTDKDRALAGAVRTYLNGFEQLALGVQLGVLDKSVVRTMARQITMNAYDFNKPFIQHQQREQNTQAMESLEWLVGQFAADDSPTPPGAIELDPTKTAK